MALFSKFRKKPVAARPGIKASYEAARDGRRADGWARASNQGPETSGRLNFEKLRKRSRFEARNHAVASRIVDVIVAETVGQGIRPHITGDETLERLWEQFVQEADADGIQSFYGLQSLAMRDTVIAGEVFPRFRPRRIEDGLPVPMQIQLLSSEFLPYDVPTRPDSRSGIVFGGPGKRTGYLFHTAHPGESDSYVGSQDLTLVPADRVAHIYAQREIGQLRGEPWLTRAIIKMLNVAEN